MTSERSEQALARIDAALVRINQAATQAHATASGMAARHERLRQAVKETLHDLDILIGEGAAPAIGETGSAWS